MNAEKQQDKGPQNVVELLSTYLGKSLFIKNYRALHHLNLSAKQHFMLLEILQWTLQGNLYKKKGISAANDIGCQSEDGVYDVLKRLKKKKLIMGNKIPNYNEKGEPAGSRFEYRANVQEIVKQVLATPYYQEVIKTHPDLLPQLENMFEEPLGVTVPDTPKSQPKEEYVFPVTDKVVERITTKKAASPSQAKKMDAMVMAMFFDGKKPEPQAKKGEKNPKDSLIEMKEAIYGNVPSIIHDKKVPEEYNRALTREEEDGAFGLVEVDTYPVAEPETTQTSTGTQEIEYTVNNIKDEMQKPREIKVYFDIPGEIPKSTSYPLNSLMDAYEWYTVVDENECSLEEFYEAYKSGTAIQDNFKFKSE